MINSILCPGDRVRYTVNLPSPSELATYAWMTKHMLYRRAKSTAIPANLFGTTRCLDSGVGPSTQLWWHNLTTTCLHRAVGC